MSELLRDFTNALDCCGTCAGGVLNRHVTDRLAAVTARAEAAEAKIARVETLAARLADPLWERPDGALNLPSAGAWRRARWAAAADLRAALADEGDTHE